MKVARKNRSSRTFEAGKSLTKVMQNLIRNWVHHKNMLGLMGFCLERGDQMLVYERYVGI